MKLYEISSEIQILLDSVDLDDEHGQEALAQMENAFKEKASEIIRYSLNLKSDAEQIKAHCDALYEKRVRIENKSKRILEYILSEMKATGIDSIKDTGSLFTAKIAKNPPSVLVDESRIDKAWVRVETVEKIDKKGILQHFKDTGEVPEGCEIVQNERLSIK